MNLDKYKIVKLLQAKGYSEEQAEGFITTLQDITFSGVATKQDTNDARTEIIDLRNELKEDIHNLKNDTLKFQVIQPLTIIGVVITLFQVF